MEILLRPWRRYADFEGRSRRTEFALFHLIYWIVLMLIYLAMGFAAIAAQGAWGSASTPIVGLLIFGVLAIFFIATVVPALALSVRRLHDQNKTGYALLLVFLPLANILLPLILLFGSGTVGPNSYGDDPRDAGTDWNADVADTFA